MPEITSISPPSGGGRFTSETPASRLPPGQKFFSQGSAGGGISSQNSLPFPWVQYIGHSPGWIGDLLIGAGDSRSSIVIDTPYEDGPQKLLTIIKYVLGWSAKIPGTTKLTRKVPWRNPFTGWHAASALAHIEGVKPVGWQRGPQGPFPMYQLWRVTVGFQSPRYRLLTDDQLATISGGGEWLRWVSHTREPKSEYLSRDMTGWTYSEGTGVAGTAAAKGSYSTIRYTTLHLLKWHFVPDDGLFNASGMSPQIDAGVGCVNATDWNGFPAGTLMLESPRFEVVDLPALFDENGALRADALPLAHHVTFPMLHFDPPRGPGVTTRGHNLVVRADDSLWYPIAAPNGGRMLYPSYEFRNLWAMN